MLPECQSLIEELSASHSTDLQQRAYELQALVTLDPNTVENIMPIDSSCKEIEIDKCLSFLNNYIQEALEKGAQPYVPENTRSGSFNITNFKSVDHHETSSHALRFEAYEVPKPTIIPTLSPSTELVPVPSLSYNHEIHQTPSAPSISNTQSTELKLRLDGVQRKWGRPSNPPTSLSDPVKIVNGATQPVPTTSSAKSVPRGGRAHVEVSPERRKLAESLFGGTSSKHEKRQLGHKASKTYAAAKGPTPPQPAQPPPDLVDLGDPAGSSSTSLIDPFKQVEWLADMTNDPLHTNSSSSGPSKSSDVSLYDDMFTTSGNGDDIFSQLSTGTTIIPPAAKGPNPKNSLDRDALVRQMGVNPTSQNPNLFRDLLG